MTPLVKHFYRLVPDAHESTWFDVGDIPHGSTATINPETITHLPYTDITLVGRDDGTPFCLYARSTNPGAVALAGFALLPHFQRLPVLALMALPSPTEPLKVWRKDNQPMDTRSRAMVATLQYLLNSLDNPHQGPRTAYRPEPLDTFTNRRKIAQGKPPAISWRTITITPTPAQAPTEAPPITEPLETTDPTPTTHGSRTTARAHTRRGHWRTLRSGKKIWVRDCQVGNPSLGLVHHDYHVKLTRQELLTVPDQN